MAPKNFSLTEGMNISLTYRDLHQGKFTVVDIFFEMALVRRDSDSFQTFIPKDYQDGKAEEFQIFPSQSVGT